MPRILLAVFVSLATTSFAFAADSSAKPNIIFFLTDDHRFDVLGCAGHPIIKTPTMDLLARDGVRFRNAFVTTAICAASRASLFTGLYERTHKYTFGTPPIAAEQVRSSYPLLLRMLGYRTGFIGKFGVGVPGKMTAEMFDFYRPLSRTPYIRKQADGTMRHITLIAGDNAVAFLRDCKKEEPFCLSISFDAPHAEDNVLDNLYPASPEVAGMYEDVTIPPPRLGDPKIFASEPEFLQTSLNRKRWYWSCDTPEKYQKNVRGYFRMITDVDRVMGQILDELKKLGMAENTVVIFSGDNGYYLGNRGFTGKWSHYEDSLRVPLIIFDPRAAGREKNGKQESLPQMVLNIDIPATILELAGREVPKAYQGRSLLPLIRGQSPNDWRHDFFCEHLMRHVDIPKWEGVRDQRWVYARYFEQKPVFEFLHDLQSDPDELKNLAADPQHAQVLAMMRRRCDELRDRYGGPWSPERFPAAVKKKEK